MSFSLATVSTTGASGQYNVASGVIGPEVKLSGQEVRILVTNTEGALSMNVLYIVFFLSL
jgi:hypothetical protein